MRSSHNALAFLPRQAGVDSDPTPRVDQNVHAQQAGWLCLTTAGLLLVNIYGVARALGHLVAATAVLKGVNVGMFLLGAGVSNRNKHTVGDSVSLNSS